MSINSTERLQLIALVANSDSISSVANELNLDVDLVTRGVNDYDGLNRRDLTVLESNVSLYIETTLADNDAPRYNDITEFAENLAMPANTVDTNLADKFFTMVANNEIPQSTFEQFEIIFGNLTFTQAEGILDAIADENKDITAEQLADTLNVVDDEYYFDESEFWEVARDYYNTD